MAEVLDVVLAGADPDACAAVPIPQTYLAAVVRRDDTTMFTGVAPEERDPRLSLRCAEVATPDLAPDEVLVAVLASAINYNTVWSAIFHPVPTFEFLCLLSWDTTWGARHDLPYHVIGSDAAGVVLRVGSLVHSWRPGDRVTVHASYVDAQDPDGHDDGMLGARLRAWGYETNFGGLGQLCVVRASQLMPKAAHLSWEEAAANGVCNFARRTGTL